MSKCHPTVVCVLGMSRCGTSLTTRILNLSGVYLGRTDALLAAEPSNPAGFWEHERIMRLNDRILESLGGLWWKAPELAPGWELSQDLTAAREEARQLLDDAFGGHRLWGWKDPRNSLTLPFWQQLIPSMRYVLCVRNPVDVVASLQRRDGIGLADGFALWEAYIGAALANTHDHPRMIVSYEQLFDDWRTVATRLARFVGGEGPSSNTDLKQRIESTIDVRLRHHSSRPCDALTDPNVPASTKKLYAACQALLAVPPAATARRTA